MKKLKKKINYLVKVLMTFGLLFTNVMPFNVVLAEELTDNDDTVIASDVGDDTTIVYEEEPTGENDDTLGEGNELDNKKTDGENTDDETTPGETTGGNGEENTPNEGGKTPIENPPADEPTEEVFTVELNDEYQIVIKYTGEYAEGSLLTVDENITYIDGTNSGDVNNTVDLTDEVKAALSGDGYVLDSQLFMDNQYPGNYNVTATIGEKSAIYNDTIEYSEMDFEIDLLAYEGDSLYADVIMPDENGKYVVGKDYKDLELVAMIGQGNACPSMSFVYGMTEYNAEDILNGILLEDIVTNGHLYGEFSFPIAGTFTDCSGQVIEINENRNIVYGTYQDNTDVLNESAKNVELDNKYVFFGDTAKGYLYTLDEVDSSEIESIIKDAIEGTDAIEYTVVVENDEVTITLMDEFGIEITYTSVKVSDNTKIVARFDSDTDEVSSGDTFTLSYVVTLNDFKINGIGGLVTYDKELLKLNDIAASKFTTGNNKDDKFSYIGDAIGGKEVTDDEGNVTGYEDEEYILLTLTFEALKAGEATISAENAKFYDASVYYEADGEISKTIIINEGTDNSLSSLTVAGQNIALEDGVLEYAITVGNDVTSADVEALVSNGSAKVTSIVAPEELAVGENTITIEVTAENGDVKVYTVKVTREVASEANTSNVAPVSYQENTSSNDNNTDDNTTKVAPTTPDDTKTVGPKDDDNSKGNNVSRIIVIILILLAIAGLIYLIFKDDDDEETKKANKDIDKLKEEDEKPVAKKVDNNRNNYKNNNRNNNNRNNYKNNNNRNSNKKER